MLVSNCTIQRRGDGKGFICTYCACQFFIDPKNQCWMTKEYINVEKKTKEKHMSSFDKRNKDGY